MKLTWDIPCPPTGPFVALSVFTLIALPLASKPTPLYAPTGSKILASSTTNRQKAALCLSAQWNIAADKIDVLIDPPIRRDDNTISTWATAMADRDSRRAFFVAVIATEAAPHKAAQLYVQTSKWERHGNDVIEETIYQDIYDPRHKATLTGSSYAYVSPGPISDAIRYLKPSVDYEVTINASPEKNMQPAKRCLLKFQS